MSTPEQASEDAPYGQQRKQETSLSLPLACLHGRELEYSEVPISSHWLEMETKMTSSDLNINTVSS